MLRTRRHRHGTVHLYNSLAKYQPLYPGNQLTAFANPGTRGPHPIRNAATARQFVPYLLY